MSPTRVAPFCVLLALCFPCNADTTGKSAPLYERDDILDVTISAPFARIMRERSTEEDSPATLSYQGPDGSPVALDIGIRTRGKYRNQWRVCPFAPLRLNFKKAEVKDTLFATADKVKLVTHCRSRQDTYQQDVLREYLAYRILNVMTDNSYRVRLLRIRYVDSEDGTDDGNNFGFLIEHRDQLADRIGLAEKKLGFTRVEDLDPINLNLTSLFQYLIGNTDFSPVAGAEGEDCCHNYSLLGDEAGKLMAIPYDFDMSGWVDAKYATPNPELRLRSVRDRLYRGRCANNAHIAASVQAFKNKQLEIYSLITDLDHLAPSTKTKLTRYLDGFYKVIDNPKRIESRLVAKCMK